MNEREPIYDAPSDRLWDGDFPLPKSAEEAVQMGYSYDAATNTWWNGDHGVRQEDIDRYQNMHW